MAESPLYSYAPEEIEQLQRFRNSVAEFKALIDKLPPQQRSLDHSQQFNELRGEAKQLLKGPFTQPVPRAITGDVNTDRSLSALVIVGVILTLTGLGINSIILEDVLVNSLGCCISSGGMLLIVGTFGVLTMKHLRERISTISDLSYGCELLLYQVDHQLAMTGEHSEHSEHSEHGVRSQQSEHNEPPTPGAAPAASAPPPPSPPESPEPAVIPNRPPEA